MTQERFTVQPDLEFKLIPPMPPLGTFDLGRLGGLSVRLTEMRTQFVCPFCKTVILEADTMTHDMAATEATLRSHLLARHPIRWRLNRRYRAAMRTSSAR